MQRRILALLLCLALFSGLAGCSSRPEFFPEETTAATEATQPAPTTPADGNPGDVTCLGTYSASDNEIISAKDTVVATMDGVNLTNSQLQIYYWLEVATHRASDHPDQPDYSQSLDTQPCPIDGSVNSWQQYFLQKALSAWHAQQALVRMSTDTGVPSKDPEYHPDLEKRAEYMTGMPATEYLYQWVKDYQPNRLHQNYLDAVPEMLKTLASDNGFPDTDAQAKAIAGPGAESQDLVSYTHTVNLAYMYFTEMGYSFEPTAEEVEAYYTAHLSAEKENGGKTVDIRHILLIPEHAEIAADGPVTATEEDWAHCETEARSLVDKWQSAIRKTRYSQFATVSVPESRFSETAKNYSQDPGSRINGGLYVQLKPGQLMPELDAWCFDSIRQHGDYEVIRTAAGWHIVFFCSSNADWYTDAESRLICSLYNELVRSAMEQYPIKIDYSAIRLGIAEDSGSFITVSDLLYPDVAHERFPDMPLYLQQDYPDAYYGAYKLKSHGCGITTMAMLASYLTDEELTPPELASRYGYYCTRQGTETILFSDVPAELGFHLQKRGTNWEEVDEALRNGQVVINLQWAGYWTRGGHYIAMIELTEDGQYVVRDSNLFNYSRLSAHLQDSHSRSSIAGAGQGFWIYEPKVTRIPACTRCGNTEGAPEIMLLTDYRCEKCLAATERRNCFLDGFAG